MTDEARAIHGLRLISSPVDPKAKGEFEEVMLRSSKRLQASSALWSLCARHQAKEWVHISKRAVNLAINCIIETSGRGYYLSALISSR
jgi:hypothetical protein